jgi:hypothetical protein
MRSRAFRSIALLLGILLLANTPANAGPVTIGDVLQTIGSYQNPPSLRLRDYSKAVASSTLDDNADVSASPTTSGSLLTGITFDTQDPQKTVSVVAPGDVEGSVCDCGVVTVAAGLPKWPLIFLAAIPLFFIKDKDCETCDEIIPNPTPTPTPIPTPTPTPEPASLLLFGSGLAAVGASLRRRRMKAKLKMQSETTEEG